MFTGRLLLQQTAWIIQLQRTKRRERFENEQAVILIEEGKEEFTVPKSKLPTGSKINTYFNVKNKQSYQIIGIGENMTAQEANRTSNLMKQLN